MVSTRNGNTEVSYPITARILELRHEFFAFIREFQQDLDERDDNPDSDHWDRDWRCLWVLFDEWVEARTDWSGGSAHGVIDYTEPGTEPYETFTQLLPYVLLAVIDELMLFPDRIQPRTRTINGKQAQPRKRSVPYLFNSPESWEKNHGADADEPHINAEIAETFLFEPYPTLTYPSVNTKSPE